ncbi:hypothetical protein HRS9122_00008 [Pyrenophora teres f. teres]|nr:hypothetical protein HRS9122_00008 [Pyrenophora teres f. teres]
MSRPSGSQYQHYIPRFLLRRFSTTPVVYRTGKNNRRQRVKGNEIVNVADISKYPPEITEALVAEIYGKYDMYNDNSRSTQKEQRQMENKLSGLEARASKIIARIIDTHRDGKDGIWLSRPDKDLLRKFLFVMKYRGPIFFKRFNHQTAEEYSSDDRIQFLRYMQEKGFRRPLDVWFDNLNKIIDMDMDPAGHWAETLAETIYPPDADWVQANIRSMYLALVSPSDTSEEFILTENAFGIHEGPVSISVDRLTGKITTTASTEFHLLNVISPHLALVLRSNYLPEPFEDMNPRLSKNRKLLLDLNMLGHIDPDATTSLLYDLPVAKARNSYTTVVDGCILLADGADGKPRPSDKFYFTFFQLETRHLQTINTVMLDQAHCISTLVYKSQLALRKALEFYLSASTQTTGIYSIKTIGDRPDDPMLLLLRKLEHLAHQLGSDVKANYHVNRLADDNDEIRRAIPYVMKELRKVSARDPLAMTIFVLIGVLEKLRTDIPTMCTLDRTLADQGRLPYPNMVFQAVHSMDPITSDAHIMALRTLNLEAWKLAWKMVVVEDSAVRLNATIHSVEAGPAPDSISAFATENHHISLLENPDTKDEFNLAIACVLKTAKPILPNKPQSVMAVVMVQVAMQIGMNIRAIHALDTMTAESGIPSYVELIFRAVQTADPASFSEHTKDLPAVDFQSWYLSWSALVEKALQQPELDIGEYLENMRRRFSEHTVAVSPQVPPASVPIRTSTQQEPGTHLQTLTSNRDHRSPETYDAQTADPDTGLFRRGLSRAFAEMAHNTTVSNTVVGKANPDPTHLPFQAVPQ